MPVIFLDKQLVAFLGLTNLIQKTNETVIGSRQLKSVNGVYILERTCPSFAFEKLGTFISFQVTHVFQGEVYKMKVVNLKCYKFLNELCL